MEHFQIRPISEDDVEQVMLRAGGRRAHPDAHRRTRRGADFVLGNAVVELKALDENGLEKPERQAKLAVLFRDLEPERPVIVLDRRRLPPAGQRAYDHALEGPIKSAAASARGQLRISRQEIGGTERSVLFVVNNGYTALNHDELKIFVARRVRNDSREIDGVIVGGCYFHSDTYDSYFLWPLDYIPITLGYTFPEFDRLHAEWNDFANDAMTELIVSGHSGIVKGPVVDTEFEIDGVTYVKPAPPIGKESDFFVRGRPRKNSSGLESCPPVGLTFPDLTFAEWTRLREALVDDGDDLLDRYDAWQDERERAVEAGTPTRPFVGMPATVDGWSAWCAAEQRQPSLRAMRDYANALFQMKIQALLAGVRRRQPGAILPVRYVLVLTEEIGQDKANDVSHIAMVREFLDGDPKTDWIVENLRAFHEHALAIGCAYAIARGVGSVLWEKEQTYGWA